MNGTLLIRTRLARPVAAGLSVVLLALSVAAGFHRGDHDDLGWLPERFHRHDFRWAVERDGAQTPLFDHCTACHLGRTLVRLAPSAPSMPDVPALVFAEARTPGGEAQTRTTFPNAPRAPPAS